MSNSTKIVGLGPTIRLLCLTAILCSTLLGAGLFVAAREYGRLMGPMAEMRAQFEAFRLQQRLNGNIVPDLLKESKELIR